MENIDNFELIKNFLEFENEYDFYFIQIIKRRKDKGNEDMKKGTKVKENYHIYNKDDLDKIKEDIINKCKLYNARCYINLNKRNNKKITLQTLKLITEFVISENYKSTKNAYNKCCGRFSSASKKRWILDIDNLNEKPEIQKFLQNNNVDIIGEIPTKNGVHLIVSPFNSKEFKNFETSIHKDNPTLLYF